MIAGLHAQLSSKQETDFVHSLMQLSVLVHLMGVSSWSIAAGLGVTKWCRDVLCEHWRTAYDITINADTTVFAEPDACARSFLQQQHPDVRIHEAQMCSCSLLFCRLTLSTYAYDCTRMCTVGWEGGRKLVIGIGSALLAHHCNILNMCGIVRVGTHSGRQPGRVACADRKSARQLYHPW